MQLYEQQRYDDVTLTSLKCRYHMDDLSILISNSSSNTSTPLLRFFKTLVIFILLSIIFIVIKIQYKQSIASIYHPQQRRQHESDFTNNFNQQQNLEKKIQNLHKEAQRKQRMVTSSSLSDFDSYHHDESILSHDTIGFSNDKHNHKENTLLERDHAEFNRLVQRRTEKFSILCTNNNLRNNCTHYKISITNNTRTLLAIPHRLNCPVSQPSLKLPGKKGIAFTLREHGQNGSWVENIPRIRALDVRWNYNWSPHRSTQQPPKIEFIPMTWNGAESTAVFKGMINTVIKPQVQSGQAKRIFGFNEPDNSNQAKMSVFRALSRWDAMEKLNVPLATPSCADPYGEWMVQFMEYAEALCIRIDYIGVHWYGRPSFRVFQDYMSQLYLKYRRPIIVTEFSVADWLAHSPGENRYSQELVLNFMKKAVPWMEKTDFIYGYAWHSFPQTRAAGWTSALFDLDGKITTLGLYYKSVRSDKRMGNQSITV